MREDPTGATAKTEIKPDLAGRQVLGTGLVFRQRKDHAYVRSVRSILPAGSSWAPTALLLLPSAFPAHRRPARPRNAARRPCFRTAAFRRRTRTGRAQRPQPSGHKAARRGPGRVASLRARGLSRRHGEEAAPEGQDVSGDGDGEGGSGPRGGARGVGRPWVCCGLPVSDPRCLGRYITCAEYTQFYGGKKAGKGVKGAVVPPPTHTFSRVGGLLK